MPWITDTAPQASSLPEVMNAGAIQTSKQQKVEQEIECRLRALELRVGITHASNTPETSLGKRKVTQTPFVDSETAPTPEKQLKPNNVA